MRCAQQSIGRNFRHDGAASPRLLPDAEQAWEAPADRVCRISLEQELIDGAASGRPKLAMAVNACAVLEAFAAAECADATRELARLVFMPIAHPPKPVGQAEEARTKPGAQRIGNPFGKEDNAWLAAWPDIRSEV